MEELTQAEKEIYYWQYGRSGSFTTRLIETILNADTLNQAKLSLGFPELVEAAQRFQNESGYWKSIQERMK